MRNVLLLLSLSSTLPVALAQETLTAADREFKQACDAYLATFKRLTLEGEAAWWEANITGTDAAYARKRAADKALVDLHSDHEMFARLKAFKDKGRRDRSGPAP